MEGLLFTSKLGFIIKMRTFIMDTKQIVLCINPTLQRGEGNTKNNTGL